MSRIPGSAAERPVADEQITHSQLLQQLTVLHKRVEALETARDDCAQAATLIRRDRDLLSSLLDKVGALVVVLDRKGRFVRLNRACERLTGYTCQDLQGQYFWRRLIAPEQAGPIANVMGRVLAGQATEPFEAFWVTWRGERRLIEWSGTALLDEGGSVEYVIGTGSDITERRRAEESLKLEEMRLNSLLELHQKAADLSEREIVEYTLEEVVRLTHSAIGYMHFMNPNQETLKLYAWSKGALESCTTVANGHYPLSQAGVWADCARWKRPVIHNDYQGLEQKKGLPPGHSQLVRHASVPIVDGDKVSLVLGVGNKQSDYGDADVRQMLLAANSLWKIVQRKRAEEELRRHVCALEEADRHKDQFIAMLAHELRNPLAPISTAVQVIARCPSDEARTEAQQVIARQVDHLTRLVDDLLDVSRVTRGKIELCCEPLDLREVIDNAVEINRSSLDACQHDFAAFLPNDPVVVLGDRVRLIQVVGNLLNNAVKYTPPKGRIEVSLEQDGSHAAICVRDSGLGISRDILPRVFEPFIQADCSLERSAGGLGLGLTVVRDLVDLHRGTVEVFSAGADQGSEFTVRLPVAPNAELPAATTATATTELAAQDVRQRILVVDDNGDAAMMLAELLETLGHTVAVAHTGAEALNVADEFLPDVVLLDIGLPEMDGYEVARRLRARQGSRSLLLAAVTGYGHAQAVQQSRDAGFDVHLVKPLRLDDLDRLLAGEPIVRPAT